jgi:flavin reductase (DIM6/NTAB) family NADH-FMN oxidoreductase RutF
VPTTKLTDEVIAVSNSSGTEIDKFEEFGLTAEKAAKVKASLIDDWGAVAGLETKTAALRGGAMYRW